MEPRARIGRNRGQQSFSDQELQHFLFGHGDTPLALDSTRRVLDELATDFITELCFEAHRAAQVAGRQKVKLEDVKFACRKSPVYLGKIEEIFGRKEIIDKAKKLVDMNDDKITKSNAMGLEEEPLGAADDDADLGSVSGISQPSVSQKTKKSKASNIPRNSSSKIEESVDWRGIKDSNLSTLGMKVASKDGKNASQ